MTDSNKREREESGSDQVLESPCKKRRLDLDLDYLYCPITKQIFQEPVVCSDGHVYEREAIEEWLKTNRTSPKTRETISQTFYTSIIYKNIVSDFLENNPHLKEEQYYRVKDYQKDKNEFFELLFNNQFELIADFEGIHLFDNLRNYDTYLLKYILNYCNDEDTLIKIIENGVDKNDSDNKGNGIIHNICYYGKLKVLDHFISQGLNADSRNNSNNTPIFTAVSQNRLDVVKYLVDMGVDTEKCVEGSSPLQLICFQSGNIDLIKYIIGNNFSLDYKDQDGDGVVFLALYFNSLEVVQFILEQIADFRILANKYETNAINIIKGIIKNQKSISVINYCLERYIIDILFSGDYRENSNGLNFEACVRINKNLPTEETLILIFKIKTLKMLFQAGEVNEKIVKLILNQN